MKVDFKNINIRAAAGKPDGTAWQAQNSIEKNWLTPEQIPVKPVYTKEDLEGMEHLNYASFSAWPVFRDVCDASLDHQTVCRLLNR